METELARADVVAVPLREGAGTRIKVLEALAHRIPVVATSVAVEGLASSRVATCSSPTTRTRSRPGA